MTGTTTMISFQIATYVLTAMCLLGTFLNCRRRIFCFHIWLVANIGWLLIDLYLGLYGRAVLDLVQFFFAIYGIYQWKNHYYIDK